MKIKNSRNVPAAVIDKTASSSKQLGCTQSIVVNAIGAIIVGHLQSPGACKLGLEAVRVAKARETTDTEKGKKQ
jgi:hypothetical protein